VTKKFLVPLVLPADPEDAMEAATKQYVDAHAGNEVFVGPSDPIGANPTIELWYDSDAPDAPPLPDEVFIGPDDPGTTYDLWYDTNDSMLKAWVGGAWIPVTTAGGDTEEVFVGPDDPGMDYDIWVDTDAVGPTLVIPTAGRNLLDNAVFRVAQRGAGAVSVPANVVLFAADRWQVHPQTTGLVIPTMYRSFTAPFAGSPSNNHWIFQNGASAFKASLVANDYYLLRQGIEGYRLLGLDWGTPNAQPITLQLAVSPSRAIRIVVEFSYMGANYISRAVDLVAGSQIATVTFPGHTSLVPTYDSAARLTLSIWLASGATYNSGNPADLGVNWHTVNGNARAAGVSNLWDRANQQINIAHAQLEAGNVATPVELLNYADDLRQCQRYFQKPLAVNWVGQMVSTTAGYLQTTLPVTMRASPAQGAVPAGPYTGYINNVFIVVLTPTAFAYQGAGINWASISFSGTAATTNSSLVRAAWPDSSAFAELSAEI